ncbi:MAG: dTMP kinase [Defluviitaleaceae bacterium]|nr:dTMP kinase [Defluviitaleaceae bacterium]
MRRLFISFEGGEGAGKSTQMQMLYSFLAARGFDVVSVRDPGTTNVSEKIRNILKDKATGDISARVEALLYFAARAQMVDEIVRPALDEGKVVITDRFAHSTYVYQGYAGGMDVGNLAQINDFATKGFLPNLTFYLQISPENGLKRKAAQQDLDRIEAKGLEYHKQISAGYDKIAADDESGRIITIDATLPAEEIHNKIVSHIEKILI